MPMDKAPRPCENRLMFQDFAQHLAALTARDRRRALTPRRGVDFSSNDYLALANHAGLRAAVAEALQRGVPMGSGGSRLLRGNHEEHEALEVEAAAMFGSESALFFSSGYAANTTLFATLPQSEDLVVCDALAHASAGEGMRLGRAPVTRAAHNDANAFADAIKTWRARGGKGRAWIAVESLYSMDGDAAPLADLASLCDQTGSVLVIDEAHATGVFGPDGRGLAADLEGRENVITMRTCGKALGCEGALICGSNVVRDFLINRGRGFIFSTAPSPLMAAAVRASLRLMRTEPHLRERLRQLSARANALLTRQAGAPHTGSQIIPIILGEDRRAVSVARALQQSGFDVRAIRPPTVPEGTARLRVSVTLNVGEADIDALAAVLSDTLAGVAA